MFSVCLFTVLFFMSNLDSKLECEDRIYLTSTCRLVCQGQTRSHNGRLRHSKDSLGNAPGWGEEGEDTTQTLASASSPCCHMNLAMRCRFMSTAQTMSSLNGYLNTSWNMALSTGSGTSGTMLLTWWPWKQAPAESVNDVNKKITTNHTQQREHRRVVKSKACFTTWAVFFLNSRQNYCVFVHMNVCDTNDICLHASGGVGSKAKTIINLRTSILVGGKLRCDWSPHVRPNTCNTNAVFGRSDHRLDLPLVQAEKNPKNNLE